MAGAVRTVRALCGTGNVGVLVYDITVRESLVPVLTIPTAGYAGDVEVEVGDIVKGGETILGRIGRAGQEGAG